MRKIGFKVAGLLAIGTMVGCGGGPSSNLANATWKSTTITPEQMTAGVTSSTFTVMTMAATSTDNTTFSVPWSGTLVEVYGATGSHPGCTVTTTYAGGTLSEVPSQTMQGTGTIDNGGGTAMSTNAGCTNPSDMSSNNGPGTDVGGIENYTLMGTTLTMTGDSFVPYYGSSVMWTFMKQ